MCWGSFHSSIYSMYATKIISLFYKNVSYLLCKILKQATRKLHMWLENTVSIYFHVVQNQLKYKEKLYLSWLQLFRCWRCVDDMFYPADISICNCVV